MWNYFRSNYNCNTSKVLTINGPPSTSNLLSLNNETLEEVDSYRYLGITFTKTVSWQKHTLNICTKANKLITILLKLSKTIPKIVLLLLYSTNICSTLEYGSVVVYDNCSIHDKNLLKKTQMRADKVILGCIKTMWHAKIRLQLALPSFQARCKINLLTYFFEILHGFAPSHLTNNCSKFMKDVKFTHFVVYQT